MLNNTINKFILPCGLLKIDLLDNVMAAVIYENDPYYGDKIHQPVQVWRGVIEDYKGEKGKIVYGWMNTPFVNHASINMMKDADCVFYQMDVHKLYNLKTGERFF